MARREETLLDTPASTTPSAGAVGEAVSAVVPRRRRRRPPLQTLFVLLLVAAGAVFGIMEARNRLTHVHETDARIATHLVTISSRVAGWATVVLVKEGAQIEKQQVLATIDDRASVLLLSQLEAQRSGAMAERERLAAQRRLVDEQTQRRLETLASRLKAAEASLAALTPQLELARSELKRASSLFSQRVIPKQDLERARAAMQRIEGEHLSSAARLDEARAEIEEARAERARLIVLDREVDKLTHREAELTGAVELQRLDVEDRTIRSPIAGVVDRTFVEIGEYVNPGQRLAIVHDPNYIWVEANIKETQVRRLRVGQPVQVTVDAYPDEAFDGSVEMIGHATTASFALLPNPNPSGNFTKITQRLPVRIKVEQRERKLRPGMMVEVQVDVRKD